MEAIKSVIETLKEKYHFQQPVLEPIPNAPDLPADINSEDLLVVTKVGRAYRVDDLKARKSFTVCKAADGVVYCSCPQGKEKEHCQHKLQVIKEAKKLKKLRDDESAKKRIAANMSMYIYRLRHIVTTYERNGDTHNYTYAHYKGKLSGLRLVLRIVIES